MKKLSLILVSLGLLAVSQAQTTFTVTIENVSTAETLSTSEGSVPVPLAPGVWTIHQDGTPLFTEGELDHGHGLEALAEDGNPAMLADFLAGGMMMSDDSMMDSSMTDSDMTDSDMSDSNMSDSDMTDSDMSDSDMSDSDMTGSDTDMEDSTMSDDSMMDDTMMDMDAHYGVFNTPRGADAAGPLLPGGVYEFSFTANPGDRLSFATMFVQSNDWFYAPADIGLALFDDAGNALSGDITDLISLWDGGTEADEEAGLGANQAPRQTGPNTGIDQVNPVTLVGDIMSNGEIIKVTISTQ